MFFGQKELTIDDKSRLVLPSLYRDGFQGGVLFATLGLDNCIELYSTETFDKSAKDIMSLNDFSKEARDLKRTFLGNTFQIQIDSHNRILLPKPLAEKTKLGKKVVVVGVYDHLELWDSELYATKEKDNERNYSENAKVLLGQK